MPECCVYSLHWRPLGRLLCFSALLTSQKLPLTLSLLLSPLTTSKRQPTGTHLDRLLLKLLNQFSILKCQGRNIETNPWMTCKWRCLGSIFVICYIARHKLALNSGNWGAMVCLCKVGRSGFFPWKSLEFTAHLPSEYIIRNDEVCLGFSLSIFEAKARYVYWQLSATLDTQTPWML